MKIEDIAKAAVLKEKLDRVREPLKAIQRNIKNGRRGEFYNKKLVAHATIQLAGEDDSWSCGSSVGSFDIPENLIMKLVEEWEAVLVLELGSLGVDVT